MRQGAKKAASKKAAAKHVDPYKREVAERISTALKTYNARVKKSDEIGQQELAILVAKHLGLKEPPTQASVSGWMNVKKPSLPSNPTLIAIAEVLGASASWLILGATEE
jgi:hypothetical protein